MHENKMQHLEFIQNVITRMNANSFMIKGWCVTLISALFALAAKDTNIHYALVSFVVIPIFWILDGFHLSIEKQYRALYNAVRKKTDAQIDFDMDATAYCTGENTWINCILSKTLIPFYFSTLAAVFMVMHALQP